MPVSSQLTVLEDVWSLSDVLFTHHITPTHAFSRPISLRNPFIFYFGHLPSFAWNTFRPLFNLPPFHPVFDTLFSRGIDPDVEDPTKCHDHPAPPVQWPSYDQVRAYKDGVRHAIRKAVADRPDDDHDLTHLLKLIAEHEAMHTETLFYMLAQHCRPTPSCCQRTPIASLPSFAEQLLPKTDWVQVPAAVVPLGISSEDAFRWDNEKNTATASVDSFHIAREAVSVADFLPFVRAGSYHRRTLWTEEDWNWIRREGMQHPASWSCAGDGAMNDKFHVLTGVGPQMHERSQEIDFAEMLQWPVSVSLAEARAYAKWYGAMLPSEPQWLLAAYGTDGATKEEGKVDVMIGRPHSVSTGRVAASGVVGLVGNGWELTTTLMEEFRGFKPTPQYPEYTADFFDGKHFVLKGASWATHSVAVRPSFRNYYQARYPFVFSKFRLVATTESAITDENGDGHHQYMLE